MSDRIGGAAALTGGAAVLTLLAAGMAQAQQQAIENCRAMPSDAERIACLEQALMDDSMGRPAEPAAAGAAGGDGGGLRLPSISLPSMPFFGRDDADGETVTSETRPAAPRAQPPSAEAAPESFGAEQVAAARGEFQRSDPGRLRASIAAMDADHRGVWTVRLENGQAWRQTERVAIPLRLDMSEPQPVEIWRSGFGGYRMDILSIDRTIKVRRQD